jgi:O-antigen/teichoic acid export membrane protein
MTDVVSKTVVSSTDTHKQILVGALAGSLNTIVTAFVSVILTAIAVRTLPKELSGVYFLCLNFSALIMLADFGISPTLSREIAFATGSLKGHGLKLRVAALIGTTTRMFIITATSVFVISVLLGLFYFSQTVSLEFKEKALQGWFVFALGSAFNVFASSAYAGLYGLGMVTLERAGRAFAQILGLIISCIAIASGMGFMGLCVAWLLQGLIACISGWVLLYKNQPNLFENKLRYESHVVSQLVKPSLKWAATSLGAYLIFNTANLIIGVKLGPAAVSEFSLIARMAQFAQTFSLAIVISASPHISREFAKGNIQNVRQILQRNLNLGMVFIVTITSFLAIFPNFILNLWVGTGHFAGYSVLIPYLIMTILETHHVIHANAVMATGHLPFIPWAIGSGILTVIFCILLINPLGLAGASIGIMLAQMMTNNWYAPFYSIRLLVKNI